MKILELVKVLFDDKSMTDEEAGAVLWGCTGYPSFFTGNPVKCLCYQLRHAKRSLSRGFTIDDIYCGEDKVKVV